MPLPILANKEEARPYILASRYTNGAVAIAAIGRTLEHEYISSPASVTATLNNWEKPIGLFGYFKDVTLVLSEASKNKIKKIYAQDLAGDTPVDITRKVKIYKDRIIIPGKIITEVGLMSGTEGDISDPGLVMKIITR